MLASLRLYRRKFEQFPITFRLIKEAFPNRSARRAFSWLCRLAITVPIIDTLASAIFAWILTLLSEGRGMPLALAGLLMLAALNLLSSVAWRTTDYLYLVLARETDRELDMRILLHRCQLDPFTLELPRNQSLLTRVNENGSYRVGNASQHLVGMIESLVRVLYSLIVIAVLSPFALIVLLAAALPALPIAMASGQKIWGIHAARARIRRRYWNLRGVLETPAQMDVQVHGAGGFFQSRIRQLYDQFLDDVGTVEKHQLWFSYCAISWRYLLSAGVITYALVEAFKGRRTVGEFAFISSTVWSFSSGSAALLSQVGYLFAQLPFLRDLAAFLQLSRRKTLDLGHHPVPPGALAVEFRNVTFRYPTSGRDVLSGISLRFEPGEKVAIVGQNGSGKSTVLRLLLRHYDPSSGTILVNGTPVQEFAVESFYDRCAVSMSGPFQLTLEENIYIGRCGEQPNDRRKQDSAAQALFEEVVHRQPKGYQQQLGVTLGGIELSSGERQRLTLAKVFYRDADLLLLDEPTSALDALAEERLFDALLSLKGTVIFVSHRFSTVRKASKIIVLEQGRVSGVGTHEELVKLHSLYRHMFEEQRRGYG